MPQKTDLNVSPYFDDFDARNQYYKVLFKPGTAVQVRELNQLQTILQNQIASFGQNIFKEGSVIKGCSFTFDNNYDYVKLNDTYANTTALTITDLQDLQVTNKNGINAIVLNADEVRADLNKDLGFTPEDRIEQARRMGALCRLLDKQGHIVIADFVCPTEYYRLVFDADFVVWMDTIKEGRFEDTNKLFETPRLYDIRVTDWADHWIEDTAALILSINSSQQ